MRQNMDDDGKTLDILLNELGQVRDDERSVWIQIATLFSVALTLIVVLAALAAHTCYGSLCRSHGANNLTPVPLLAYIGLPLLPAAIVSYVLLLSTQQTLRSYYGRVVERKIHKISGQGNSDQPVPLWSHIQPKIMGGPRGGSWVGVNWAVVYVSAFLILTGFLIDIAVTKIPGDRHRVLAIFIDLIVLLPPLVLARRDIQHGSDFWKETEAVLKDLLARTDGDFESIPKKKERRFASFLIMPRTRDDLAKTLLMPATFLLLAYATPGLSFSGWSVVWRMLEFWFIFEFIAYQTRYLINDVRDRNVDTSQVTSKPDRFPFSRKDDEQSLRLAYRVFCLRIVVLGVLVVCALPIRNGAWEWHLCLIVSIGLIAVPYEFMRASIDGQLMRQSQPGGTDTDTTAGAGNSTVANSASGLDATSEKSAVSLSDRTAKTSEIILLICTVGLGYGLRVIAGYWLAGELRVLPLFLATLGGLFFGSMFVTLAWMLESTRLSGSGEMRRKVHLLWFRDHLFSSNMTVGPSSYLLRPGFSWRKDRRRDLRQRLLWIVPMGSSTYLMLALVCYLLSRRLPGLDPLLIGVVLLPVLLFISSLRADVSLIAMVLVLLSGIIFFLRQGVNAPGACSAGVLVACPMITASIFRRMSFDEMSKSVENATKAIRKLLSEPPGWFRGSNP